MTIKASSSVLCAKKPLKNVVFGDQIQISVILAKKGTLKRLYLGSGMTQKLFLDGLFYVPSQ